MRCIHAETPELDSLWRRSEPLDIRASVHFIARLDISKLLLGVQKLRLPSVWLLLILVVVIKSLLIILEVKFAEVDFDWPV